MKGLFFYRYRFLDVFSRKIVGWEVFAREIAEPAATVLSRADHREGITSGSLVLPADNGGPMQGATLRATWQRLGVMPAFSRPSVSDDNPCSAALFQTLKCHPGVPASPSRTWMTPASGWRAWSTGITSSIVTVPCSS